MKLRLKGAQKGHSLLKKKSDALSRRFRIILQKIDEVGFLWTAYGVAGSNSGCRHAAFGGPLPPRRRIAREVEQTSS
jgi:hypothetical protein